jgi:hypothetical protein
MGVSKGGRRIYSQALRGSFRLRRADFDCVGLLRGGPGAVFTGPPGPVTPARGTGAVPLDSRAGGRALERPMPLAPGMRWG